jgi:putative aminopeptidase FrvX
LYTKKAHKNDIIILFSDAEELGLNGAFATQHNWAKEGTRS